MPLQRHRIVPVAYGPDAWLLRFAEQPGEAAFQAMRAITHALAADPPAGLIEVVPGYTSVLVEFSPGTADIGPLTRRLAKHLETPVEPGPIKDIPVIYDGPDLARVAEHTGLTVAELCARHAAPLYRVALIGFAPGFPYLEGLERPCTRRAWPPLVRVWPPAAWRSAALTPASTRCPARAAGT